MSSSLAADNLFKTSASQSQFAFKVQDLAETTFMVKSFSSVQHALDQDYCFEVVLQSAETILPTALVGRPAVLELAPADAAFPPHIAGVIKALTWAGMSPGGREYVASLASPLYPFTLQHQQRIFLNRSIPQIIEEVIGQGGFAVELKNDLQQSYPPREYTVQYGESDYDFVLRLAASVGLFFRFEMDAGQARVVFHDSTAELPAIPGEAVLSYHPQTGTNRDQETIFSFTSRAEAITAGVDLRDYNYRTPETLLDSCSGNNSQVSGAGRAYRFAENHKDLEQAQNLANMRQQELDWQRQCYFAETDCRTAAPGQRLSMTGHPDSELNGEYLIIAVDHQGQQQSGLANSGQAQGMTYRNRLTLIPFRTPYRPPQPEPQHEHGVFTAKIETSGGAYAYLDEQGRYRVRLDFDAGSAPPGQASHAARLLQPYAGDNFGSHTPLHPGTEVALTCVNGDLDRPVILGVLPNPQTPSPVTAANPSQNILRSFSDNELLMEDRKEQERIELFTRERKNQLNLNAKQTGHKVSLLSKEGEMELFAGKTLLKDSGDTHSTVAGDSHLITVENSQRLMTKNQQIDLQAATDIRLKAADNIHLMAEKNDIQLRAEKDMVIRAAEGMSVEVRNQNLSLLVKNGELSIDVAKEITILGQGGGSISIGQGAGKVEISAEGAVSITAPKVDINAQAVGMGGGQNAQGGGGGAAANGNQDFATLIGSMALSGINWFMDMSSGDAHAEDSSFLPASRNIFDQEKIATQINLDSSSAEKIDAVPGYSEKGSDAWRAANDKVFVHAVSTHNQKYNLQKGDPGYWTPERLKAQAMIESGGHPEAFLRDPLQVNNPGDWVPEKSKIGLKKGEEMTPEKSCSAALEWLRYKGWKHDIGGRKVDYRGDREALRRYNGNTRIYPKHPGVEHRDWYADEVLRLEKLMR